MRSHPKPTTDEPPTASHTATRPIRTVLTRHEADGHHQTGDDDMSVREAEHAAEQLLGPSPSVPVNPEAIARSLGISVRYAGLPPDQSGKIVIPPNGVSVITINEYDHPNRQRFTCAHEIGHYQRRRKGGPTTFVDYRDTLAGLGQDPEEIFANQFAAALLMPASLVARYCRQGYDAESLAVKFGTSVQAMKLRLRNLGLA